MNDRVKEVLLSCGWHEGRIVDISEYMNWYQSEGYKPSLTIKEFLKKFGGLEIQIPRKNSHNKSEDLTDIIMICDPKENGYEFEFISDYNKHFNADIYPIAISTGPPDIFMDSTGAFYAMYGSIGAKWGNSFEEFILNIMNGNVSDLERVY